MARLPPSRHPLHCGLRVPDLRAGDDSPLRGSGHHVVPAICPTRRLPAQRIRRCGLNATSRTRLQRCDGDWRPLSPQRHRVAHAARPQSQLGTDIEVCDTVRLGKWRKNDPRGPAYCCRSSKDGVSDVLSIHSSQRFRTPTSSPCSMAIWRR